MFSLQLPGLYLVLFSLSRLEGWWNLRAGVGGAVLQQLLCLSVACNLCLWCLSVFTVSCCAAGTAPQPGAGHCEWKGRICCSAALGVSRNCEEQYLIWEEIWKGTIWKSNKGLCFEKGESWPFEPHLLWIPNNNTRVGFIYKLCFFIWKIFECYLILLAGLQGKDICTYATVLVLIW